MRAAQTGSGAPGPGRHPVRRSPARAPSPRLLAAAVLLSLSLLAAAAPAHEGPPYALFVDRAVGPYTLSVWADPDVGTGTFFVVFDPDPFRSPSDPRVTLDAWPPGGRLPPARVAARRQRDRSYRAEIAFDREETWTIRLEIQGTGGAAATEFAVEVTPPGYGRWDLLIYLVPFLMVGGLWAAVALRRRRGYPPAVTAAGGDQA